MAFKIKLSYYRCVKNVVPACNRPVLHFTDMVSFEVTVISFMTKSNFNIYGILFKDKPKCSLL